MKKFIGFILTALLVCSLGLTAAAADPALTLQADEMTIGGEFELTDRDYASNGMLVTLPGDETGDSGWVEAALGALEDGIYDIVFWFNDENDGQGLWEMEIGGSKILEFVTTLNFPSPNADIDSYTSTRDNPEADAALRGVSVNKGDSFKLTYTQNWDNERGRLDRIEFFLVSLAAAEEPEPAPAAESAPPEPEVPAPAPAQVSATPAPITFDPLTLIVIGSIISAAGAVTAKKRK